MNGQAPKKPGGPRSAARLGAVQALYQLGVSEDPKVPLVIEEFIRHRLGAEIEGDQYVEADTELFGDIVKGAWERRADLDEAIRDCLTADWPLERLESIIHAIFRAGAYELSARPDVPTAVVINEYLDVAHAFYERAEAAFVNGVLDKLARTARS
ncbi:transcription antitermination factor NusB [Pseudokordiimonas caeni]|uniref:transcription antitermination factor NusB n=1 Tax=Pseudokordiimonas caeni TaxID=2997908 RepID=UPI0028115CBA|nr:transcription antitermination factor NusB [Pseudokordiimonas caeni]